MATKKDLIEELNFVTDLISDRVRTVSAGILAFGWLFMQKGLSPNGDPSPFTVQALLVPVLLAMLALLCDFLQYLWGFSYTRHLLKELESAKRDDIEFDYASPRYRARTTMFYAKQGLTLVAALWLIVIVGAKTLG